MGYTFPFGSGNAGQRQVATVQPEFPLKRTLFSFPTIRLPYPDGSVCTCHALFPRSFGVAPCSHPDVTVGKRSYQAISAVSLHYNILYPNETHRWYSHAPLALSSMCTSQTTRCLPRRSLPRHYSASVARQEMSPSNWASPLPAGPPAPATVFRPAEDATPSTSMSSTSTTTFWDVSRTDGRHACCPGLPREVIPS